MKAAFAGERGAYGELAVFEYFGKGIKAIPVAEFNDVFKAVTSGKTSFGMIPIENSLAGSIHQNYDSLLENNLFIVGEILLRVSHCLIVNPGVLRRNIRRVFSHPQALAQCKRYLAGFPSIEIVPFSNTAAAVKMIKDKNLRDAAAISSMQAVIDFDMACLAKNIEDNPTNMTRFIVLSKNPLEKRKRGKDMKTSIVFSTKDIPGALFKSLSVFALRDINLFKIESRPVHGKGFEYIFYLDFSGDINDEVQKNAINHLQEITSYYRMLGSYHVGRVAHPEYKRRGKVG
jgi:prephenate dehydratase